MTIKLGVSLPQTTDYDLATDITDAARTAEKIGYDSVWAFERVLLPHDQSGAHGLYGVPDLPWPALYGIVSDPLITLAMAAAVTSRVELGTGVLVAPLHLPVKLAKTLASLDHSSRGRVIAGLGSGWSVDEFAATAPRPIAERGAALDEFLDVAAAVWGPNPVAVNTGRYRIDPADVNPKPARPMPVYLAGSNRTAFRRIARRADGWLPTGISSAETVAGLAQIRQLAEEEGRDPAQIRCVYQIGLVAPLVEVPEGDRKPFTGSAGQLAADIAELAEGGVDHVYATLPYVVRDRNEYYDRLAEFHASVRETVA
ncbi:TIGR03619 family F420-dependent LLM class oxidoreductase [Actinoplanes sp. TRM 88003]|uniref:TIGR03619 family F420-dependent LLM class oxidoreductase n=1 Tax=Paractinoplanes aksuensis TaxID=2939490 RepID=A0ABT1DXI6_9ACTN|nr:TIGR03619 family F420-dependent LLM class oxidoreductase [Actinoplanes aksuensis]MCO8275475.1 TIGR03619 family F420-dependent LLM class oxidoreductase [Actinoplanes aksuensis]